MSKHSGEKIKMEKNCSNTFQGHISHYQLMSGVWPVNTKFQNVGKLGFCQTQLEAIQKHFPS